MMLGFGNIRNIGYIINIVSLFNIYRLEEILNDI